MLFIAGTTMTVFGQAETPADALAKVRKAHANAEAGYTATLKSEPNNANLYQQRGVVRFFQLKFTESLADFDKFIEMTPSREPYHWQRGLVHYYAGKYKDGRKQFESHQTVNTQDVENAVWHYLCVSKIDGVKEAEKLFIKITSDRRVPLKGNPRALRRQRHRTASTRCHQGRRPRPSRTRPQSILRLSLPWPVL